MNNINKQTLEGKKVNVSYNIPQNVLFFFFTALLLLWHRTKKKEETKLKCFLLETIIK